MSENEAENIQASEGSEFDKPEYAWCKRLLDEVDFADVPVKDAEQINKGFTGMLDESPEWVGNLNREIVQKMMPTMPFSKLRKKSPPEVLGLYLGQTCATLYAINNHFRGQSKEENIKAAEAKRKFFEQYPELPSVQSEMSVVNSMPPLLQHLQTEVLPGLMKAVHDAFKTALEQKEYSQAVVFFQGFAKGISKPGLSSDGKLAGNSDATPIYEKLMLHRDQVQKLPSYPALQKFLIDRGLPKNVVGTVKHLQKLVKRLGLSIGKRGRPSKSQKKRHAS
jgi:hypothetical protein